MRSKDINKTMQISSKESTVNKEIIDIAENNVAIPG